MGAAVRRFHIIGKRNHALVETVVVLQRHLGHRIVQLALQVNHVRMQHFQLVLLVDILYKTADAALIAHAFCFFHARALVCEGDAHTGI